LQAKQPAAARLAQQAHQSANAAPPRSPAEHARAQGPRAPDAPDDRRAAPQEACRTQPRGDLCRKHNGQHLYRDCPDRKFDSKSGDKVVNFGHYPADGNKARSSKATAFLHSPRRMGSFSVLADLDGEDFKLERSSNPSGITIQTKTAKSSAIPTEKAHVLSASDVIKGCGDGTFACADSGASLHIVDEKLITEDRKTFVKGTVMWGDGSSAKTVVSGTVSATLTGKDGTKQMIRFPAWGVQQLATPLLSATAFARGGAALHVEKGNTYLDFRKLGGKRLLIGDDCMMRFNLSGSKQSSLAKANGASTSAASPKLNRRSNRRRARRQSPPSPSLPGN
jgi:hypothetical protein